ncbi:MAG: ArnT family glycosyltransferase [Candidatus Dormibacteraceae bacterium]
MSAITQPRLGRAMPERHLAIARAWYPSSVRPSFVALMLVTSVLYVWGLDRNGWANAYYAAAVQAGTQNWKAFFFGSLDASNFITVDKSPAFLWVMEISARIFGFNTWSVMVPQALEGVATVALVYLGTRRWFGPGAGLLAGAVVALTPAAALMFRYNNPDALLTLLLTAGAYTMLRAVESGKTRWLVLAAALVGTGFLAKMLQAFVVVPVFVLVYLVAGKPRILRRIKQLVIAGVTLVVASGWWVAAVELWPSADRPYIGGSQNNSVLNLIFGYNGFGRLTGNETGSVGGLGAIGARWGLTGWNRLFLPEFGGQISWLIPAAVLVLAAGLWLTRLAPRHDVMRASLVLWGGWLLVTGGVFSFAQGIIHPYYSIALAPPIGALVGTGTAMLWNRRSEMFARLVLAGALVVTAGWAYVLLDRSPEWNPTLKTAILILGMLGAGAIVALPAGWKRLSVAAAVLGVLVVLLGPVAYTMDTVTTAHSGAIPSAGPAVLASTGGPRAAFGGGFRGQGGPPPGGAFAGGANPPRGIGAGGGGFLNATQPGSRLVAMLKANASHFRWAAATVNANAAAGYELTTGDPVMAIGGFNGSDPAPTLAQFQAMVNAGQIHYYMASGGGFRSGSASTGGQIATWVNQHFAAVTVDGVTIYDLTAPTS